MPEFLELALPQAALSRLLDNLSIDPQTEQVETVQALGRVTASPVTAPIPLPSFPRSTVDGYAVRAADTFGASENLPAYLKLAGEVPMGDQPPLDLVTGECCLIHTGGMLPVGANAVVMLEYTQIARPGEIEILRGVAAGENVLEVGEDVLEGQEVLPARKLLRPAEIGGLMALGVIHLLVVKRPSVAILSTGDEVIPPHLELRPGKVRDVNSYSLSGLVESAGGIPDRLGILPDREDVLFTTAAGALAKHDMLIITAGSSASSRDLTAQVINRLGPPGVLVHGVNVKPGKPTILGVCQGKAVIGLPGNPVSALVIARLFVIPVLSALSGLRYDRPRISVSARLVTNIASQAGREDWIPVRLQQTGKDLQAEPLFGKSNLIFTLTRADGLLRIPADLTGLAAGEIVEVEPL